MARGNKSPALFEVIQKGNKSKSASPTRKWWFSKAADGPAPAATVEVVIPPPARPTTAAPTMAAPGMAAPGTAAPGTGAAPLEGVSRVSAPTPPGSASRPVAVSVDPDRNEISFRMTLTSMVIVAFAVIVCIVLVVIAGRKLASPAQPAQPSAGTVAAGPSDPNVLSPRTTPKPVSGGPLPPMPPGVSGGGSGTEAPPTVIPPPPTNTGKTQAPNAPPAAPASATRKAGLNYLVVQSYPEEADAKAAVDVLAREGVPATIERKLRGFNASWYQVVTTEGYTGRSDPAYDKMMNRLKSISDKTRSTNRKFKALEPVMFKWQG